MRTRAALVVLAAVVGLTAVTASPAAATHPCPQSGIDPSFTSDHDACGGGLPPAQPGDVTVTNADNGRTVTVPLGNRLRVALDAAYDQPVWSDIDASLHRSYLDVQRPRSSAVFETLQSTDGTQVTATGATPWSVTVVVPSGQASTPPAESCQTQTVPVAGNGAVVLSDADNGRTVQVQRGDAVAVFFPGCQGGFDFQPATATAPLQRYRARGRNPGGASAVFSTMTTGTSTVTAVSDAACFHASPACLAAQRNWQVTVQVVEACTLTGPATVPAGSDAWLYGGFAPGATVQIWFRPYGGTTFTARRTLTADSFGTVATSYRAVVDQRWYATSGGCTSAPGLTQVMPSIQSPATSRRGTTVPIVVRGPAGIAVQVWFASNGSAFTVRRTGHLDAAGVFRTSYVATTDQRYYAVTGPDRRTTTTASTAVS